MTYENLFALLGTFGFKEQPPGDDTPRRPRVFVNEARGAVLLFRGDPPGEPVTPADLLSADVHLRAKGFIDQPLESLLDQVTVSASGDVPDTLSTS